LSAKLQLPRIYPITDTQISGISHLEQVKKLILGGAALIQLRDKCATPADFYAAAKESVKHAREYGVLVIINDRVDIAMAAGADGVHLGQDDMPVEQARHILGHEAIIGLSTHSVEQAREALSLPVDYMATGPIFDTGTKDRADPVVGIEGLRMVRAAIGPFPLVAIGGIDEDNLQQVTLSGADSAAIIGGIIRDSGNIEDKMRLLSSLPSK
jgi:thiamine-phosphate pyrophosphorylase